MINHKLFLSSYKKLPRFLLNPTAFLLLNSCALFNQTRTLSFYKKIIHQSSIHDHLIIHSLTEDTFHNSLLPKTRISLIEKEFSTYIFIRHFLDIYLNCHCSRAQKLWFDNKLHIVQYIQL